ncbi:cytochrome d ubiquinol oxidase subunit II [Stappia sp. F7233]|uniref:Cytochrome d ubiquinol oxidase subunit II n=1 Tax=Stappia albiluteola TaxID=2758565 RepID=A0A839AA37_9HYPH|nr:cytochrome d ubiquinol oxidase subunit II [Stappia albiluteola]MBA5775898.1 cytochrome d ubiquinol oxidase subunit II [Stappia albiluteola]
MPFDLPFIWALLIAVSIFAYVVLDGFDLGVGILFPFSASEDERSIMINAVAPVWDGNETWLILGGGGLFAVFPLAYSVLMPALYAPIIAMLIGLVFRGVVFEFRFKSSARSRPNWDLAFFLGSLVATFAQGVALGTVVQGVAVEGRAYAGGWYDWLSPFTLMTGAALVAGYGLLGATWLVWKTEGPVQQRFRSLSGRLAIAVLGFIGVVSLWMPLSEPEIFARWFAYPASFVTLPVPVLVAACAGLLFAGLKGTRDSVPFLAALGLFLLSYVGLAISLYPFIVPRSITIWQAAAPQSSLAFLLVGAVILLPLILGYTAYAYWVFRGKIRPGEGYH